MKTAKGKNKNPKNNFKKGVSGNPKGKPPLPPEILAIRKGSKQQIIEAYGKFSEMPIDDAMNERGSTLVEEGVLKSLKIFSNTGDTQNISKLWDQVHGKPIQPIGTENGDAIEIRFVD